MSTLSPRRLIPPQVSYLKALELGSEEDLIALGEATIQALMHLWLDRKEADFSLPLGMLHALRRKANARLPILPCLRTSTYVQFGDEVVVYHVTDKESGVGQWVTGLVTGVYSGQQKQFLAQCLLREATETGGTQLEILIESPYLLRKQQADQFTVMSQQILFINNWVHGVSPHARQKGYNPMQYSNALQTRKRLV